MFKVLLFCVLLCIKVDKNIFKRVQSTAQASPVIPDHFASPLEANYRAVLSKVCTKKLTEDDSNKKQKNKKPEQKPEVIDGNDLIQIPCCISSNKNLLLRARRLNKEDL